MIQDLSPFFSGSARAQSWRVAVQSSLAFALAALILLAWCSIGLAPMPASASGGQCKWEGGPGSPTYPSCRIQDCLEDGGVARCQDPDIVPPVPRSASEADGQHFTYTVCHAGTHPSTGFAWCTLGGGSYANGSCTYANPNALQIVSRGVVYES